MSAYALLLVNADGVKCADQSAPAHHIDTILIRYHAPLEYLSRLPDDKKDLLIHKAISLEAKNARRRENDNYLCRFGLQEMQASMQKFGEGKEVPTQPGHIGKTVELPYDPTFQPQFLPGAQWGQKQAEARTHFMSLLTSLTDQLKNPPPPPTEPPTETTPAETPSTETAPTETPPSITK
jgi:hypothetical protein